MKELIKAYTDISQSKKLAEILPLESADMLILNNVGRSGNIDGTNCITILKENLNPLAEVPEILPCWSLAALLGALPFVDFTMPQLIGTPKTLYRCIYNDDLKSHVYDNAVDACVDMIERLHKLNLL